MIYNAWAGTSDEKLIFTTVLCLNFNQIVKMKNGKRSVAFLHFKFQRAIGFYVLQVLKEL